MFSFKKSEPGLLPFAQENQDNDDLSERQAMLDHEYPKHKSQSRSRRVLSSNIPWILTTVALSLYIFIFVPHPQKNRTPWSPTDLGKYLSMTKFDDILG
jgi:hypothetical protein